MSQAPPIWKSATQQVWKPALRRIGITATFVFLLAAFAHAQNSQFLFDANGNLFVQTTATTAPPQIIGQPQNRVVAPGDSASFFVVAVDTRALTYQWRFNNVPLGGSATNDALLLQNVGTNNEGQYSVVLTNPSGSVTSAPALLMLDSDADGVGDSWELTYFGHLTNSATADFDGDGVSNLQEFLDDTNPTNSVSARYRILVFLDGGAVVKSPDQSSYTNGESVTLTAIASTNTPFHAWIGDINTRSNPVTLVMTNNKTVTARFTPIIFTWTNVLSGDWDVGTNWAPKLAPGTNDIAILTSNVTVTLNTDADCAEVTLTAGTLAGSGALTVRSNLVWTAGTMTGNGRTILETNATLYLNNPAALTLNTRTLENGGTALWTGAGNITMNNGVITNRAGALFHAQNAAMFVWNGGNPRFDNAGAFRKSVNAGVATVGNGVSFNNSGAVEIQAGTLRLADGSATGTFDAPATTSVEWNGTFTLNAGAQLNGAGLYNVNGGTLIGNTTLMVGRLDLIGGTLDGTGTVTISNAMNWAGGIMSGSGRTIIPSGVTLNLSNANGVFLFTRTLENGGTVLWTGAGGMTMEVGAVITNRAGALLEYQSAASLVSIFAPNRIDNAGTFRKSVNSGTTTVPTGVSFNNSGMVEIQTGALNLNGGGTHSGSFSVPAGTALTLGGTHTAGGSSSITGGGQLIVSGDTATAGLVNVSGSNTFSGTANLTGNYICTNNTVTISGTANFNGTGEVSPAVLNLSGSGTLDGSNLVTVGSLMNWTSGTMSGSGRTIIAAGATLNLSGASAVFLGRTLENGGTVLWTGAGGIGMGVITNRAGALFDVRNAASFSFFAASPRFDNAGTFRKSASTGTTPIANGVSFTNYGTVDIRSGILLVNGGYASSSNALLNCALGGTTPGTNYGQLQVAGSATLSGALSVDLINGFVPATNDTFSVLTAGTRNGTFANFYYPSNAAAMQLSNTASSVIVRVTNVFRVPQPAPVPAGLISWWRAEGNTLDTFGTNHGTAINGTSYATGMVGQAFALDGVNDYVSIPDSPTLRPASVTLESWVKFFATNGIRLVFAKPLGASTVFNSYGLAFQDGAVLALICDSSGFGPFLTGPANTVPGQWYHLAYTFDDTSKQQALYVNGVSVASGTANKTISYDTSPLLLGADVENGVLSFFHNGQIDEASIYNRALTSDEIATIYNAGAAGKQLSLTPYEQWKQTYLGNPNASDSGDPDGDGFNNLAEYTADTNPTNALSNLRIIDVTPVLAGIAFHWQGGTLATQFLQRSLSLGPASSWQDLFTNLPPTPTPSSFTNSSGTNDAQFYRIRVTR